MNDLLLDRLASTQIWNIKPIAGDRLYLTGRDFGGFLRGIVAFSAAARLIPFSLQVYSSLPNRQTSRLIWVKYGGRWRVCSIAMMGIEGVGGKQILHGDSTFFLFSINCNTTGEAATKHESSQRDGCGGEPRQGRTRGRKAIGAVYLGVSRNTVDCCAGLRRSREHAHRAVRVADAVSGRASLCRGGPCWRRLGRDNSY